MSTPVPHPLRQALKERVVVADGRPRLRMWLDRVQTEGLIEAGVVYGYFPAGSEGDDLVVLNEDGSERGSSRMGCRCGSPRR